MFEGIKFGVEEWLHAHVVQAVGFVKVHDGELVPDACPGVTHHEVVPLIMTMCVQVAAQVQKICVLRTEMDGHSSFGENSVKL